MAVHLRFWSLTVTTADTEKTYRFDGPATVVSGPSGTGKSSLLMLLKHVVGGKAVLTPAVRDHVLSAQAEVVIGEQHVILKRTVNDARSGQVDVLDPGTLVTRDTFAVQADGDLPPLSDYLLAALDFPRETIPSSRDGKATTRDLKFTDLFAYVYREARNIDREVVGHLDTWFNTKRTALFKLMFALTDSTVLELSRKLGELKEELRKKTDEYEAVKNFLGATDPRTEDQLRAELASLRDMLQRADATLASLRHELEESTAADAVLRQDLRAAVDSAREATQEVQAAQELVEARAAVVAQVELDLSRLDRSTRAIEKLSPFDFVVCPRCMQRLSTRPVPEDHCVVCLQHDPHDQDVDPAAVAQTRRTLELQLQDAQAVLDADSGVLEAAQQRAQQADFLAHSLRRQLDAQTRDLVAPRFDAIADASARAASLGAAIDAVTQLRDSWSRAHAIERDVRVIKAQRASATAERKARTAELAARQTLVSDLSRDFNTMISQLRPAPWIQSATIDPSSYLPVVDNVSFESLQADGGGIVTCINVGYSLSLLEFGITHPDVRVPSMLIIDSPRKASGSNLDDQARGHRTYQRFQTLAEAHGSQIQLIIADNDSAPVPGAAFGKIELDYDNPFVPGVAHPGPEHAHRAEDES
ncbi:hypothetical protein [Streptomyces sp. NBC_00233]|uniref:hypothetical protein n=1 Tax=Streptomyces sp. NBC_00233 TaxID=2975686 RepID=UPI00224D66C1|nr:hypothetical protein [Streptomyces sp. NBC_00233]MCX5230375.1 hypothetical protein [Streptomyces sp. NBC_00233]